jgi:uncharacterized OB-fold protein
VTAPRSGREIGWPWRTEEGGEDTVRLQACAQCGLLQHPPREVCGGCLGGVLEWRATAGGGTLQAATTLHASFEPRLRDYLPLTVGSVKLDCGPVVIAYLEGAGGERSARVRVRSTRDLWEREVLVARPAPPGDGRGARRER